MRIMISFFLALIAGLGTGLELQAQVKGTTAVVIGNPTYDMPITTATVSFTMELDSTVGKFNGYELTVTDTQLIGGGPVAYKTFPGGSPVPGGGPVTTTITFLVTPGHNYAIVVKMNYLTGNPAVNMQKVARSTITP